MKSIIKNILTLIDKEEKFKELIDQIIDIDQRQFYYLQEEKKKSISIKISFRIPEFSFKSSDQKRSNISDSNSGSLSKKYINFQHELLSKKEK